MLHSTLLCLAMLHFTWIMLGYTSLYLDMLHYTWICFMLYYALLCLAMLTICFIVAFEFLIFSWVYLLFLVVIVKKNSQTHFFFLYSHRPKTWFEYSKLGSGMSSGSTSVWAILWPHLFGQWEYKPWKSVFNLLNSCPCYHATQCWTSYCTTLEYVWIHSVILSATLQLCYDDFLLCHAWLYLNTICVEWVASTFEKSDNNTT